MNSSASERGDSSSSLWGFSLAVYGLNGVAAACVGLQDEHGVDVNVLLCVLFLAERQQSLSIADIRMIDSRVQDWRREIVVPLRRVRRVLRTDIGPFTTRLTGDFRQRLKQIELESEQIEQTVLADAIADIRGCSLTCSLDDIVRINVTAYADFLGARFGGSVMTTLCGALDEYRKLKFCRGEASA